MTSLSLTNRSLRGRSRGATTRGAFTLIELLLVMVIIAILAAIVVPKYTKRMEESKISAAKGDLSSIKSSLGMFEIDNGKFPSTEEGLTALVNNPNPSSYPGWKRVLDKSTVPVDPWGTPYNYVSPGTNGADYDLSSSGPDKQAGTQDDIKSE